mmetsp:Transcript_46101/g.87957  ORF Transcript_46101/g.87957 Transcript_46101/m.87957 type:complete len:109 (+) Transcript_46101:156-482(+)
MPSPLRTIILVETLRAEVIVPQGNVNASLFKVQGIVQERAVYVTFASSQDISQNSAHGRMGDALMQLARIAALLGTWQKLATSASRQTSVSYTALEMSHCFAFQEDLW